MLNEQNTILLVIDVQEKLFRVIYQKERLLDNLQKLIGGLQVLGVPIILTEQYPQGLGVTIPEITRLLPDIRPLPKISFSCCGDTDFLRYFEQFRRQQVLVSGIESHVCVYQTAVDLIRSGYEVHVVADAISSRTQENREVGITKMVSCGASFTSTETVLFELLRKAPGDHFKAISRIVK